MRKGEYYIHENGSHEEDQEPLPPVNRKAGDGQLHGLARRHDVWAACRLCEGVISTPQQGTYVRVSDGTKAAVHRSCASAV